MSWPSSRSAAGASNRTGGNRAVLVGDSNTMQNFELSYIVSASRLNNVVSLVFSGQPFYMFQGCPVQVVGVPEDMRGSQVITSANDATKTYTYDNAGPDVPSATLTGSPCAANLSKFMEDGWFVWLNILGGQPFDLAGMSASVGRMSDEMLARVGEVTALGAPYAFDMGVTNDVMAGRALATIIANKKASYEALLASGSQVIALTTIPLGAATWTAARTALILQFNDWLKTYCRATPGMRCLDAFSAVVDPLAANKGQAAAGMIRSDGLHLTQRGAYSIGKLGAADLAGIPRNDFRITSNANNYGTNTANANIYDNSPLTSSGGTPTTLPAGVTGQALSGGTAVTSAPARADGIGFNAREDITAAAANDGYRLKSTDNTIPFARIPAGSTVQADISVSVIGNGGKFRNMSFYAGMAVAGQTTFISGLGTGNSTGIECIQEDWSGVIRTPAVRLPVAPNANPYWRLDTLLGAAGTLSVEAGRPEILVRKP